MDHGNFNTGIKQEAEQNSNADSYVVEEGKKYRVPYKIVRKVVFSELKKEDLIDIPHAARLQYRLMLLDPIIKARVDFTKRRMTIIYNPRGAENIREKISIDELRDFLAKQGVGTDTQHMENTDYDYYKEFYSYAYNPASIRERPPYGYTSEQWRAMKPEWDAKMKAVESGKISKFREWQREYVASHPESAKAMTAGDPVATDKGNPASLREKIFGKKRESEKDFWFHGI